MGTTWEITLWDKTDHLEIFKQEIFALSDQFDKTYSRFIKTSLVWKIAEQAGTYEVPEDFTNMLRIYMDLYEPSGCKLNPLIGFTISDMGYDENYSLVTKDTVRLTPDLFDTVKIIDNTHIETNLPVLFDFGALGKGYFVDRIKDYLVSQGVERFLVNGSGDIYYSSGKKSESKIPIVVGLEHPNDKTKVIGTTEMTEGSMCASGISRRAWGKYHHVINPLSNSSTEGILATWVVAKTAALADALASCLFFVAPESLSAYDFEYVIMNDERKVKVSPGCQVKLF
jgi:thiamine biosynthesis lipoprotein